MLKYTIRIDLLSESIFSGGESIVSVADLDILYDEYGIPYYKAKSLKGNLREMVDMIVNNLIYIDEGKYKRFKEVSKKLFGAEFNSKYKDSQDEGILKFENATLEKDVSNVLRNLVIENKINKVELVNSLTDIRYFIKINKDSGVTEAGSLRNIRVLNKEISMYSDVFSQNELDEEELALLLCGINSLRHLGSLRSRGKGLVKCTLLENDKEMNKELSNKLVEKVVG